MVSSSAALYKLLAAVCCHRAPGVSVTSAGANERRTGNLSLPVAGESAMMLHV